MKRLLRKRLTGPFILTFVLIGSCFAGDIVPNIGQWDGAFAFRAALPNHTAFFTEAGIRMVTYDAGESHPGIRLRKPVAHAFDLLFDDGRTPIRWEPLDKAPYYHNYYLGNDSRRWRSRVPVYHTLRAREVWPGIDVDVVIRDQQLKFLFHIRENARYEDIALRLVGADSLRLTDGQLQIYTRAGVLVDLPPVAFSQAGGISRRMALRRSIPPITRASSMLSRLKESEPLSDTQGAISSRSGRKGVRKKPAPDSRCAGC